MKDQCTIISNVPLEGSFRTLIDCEDTAERDKLASEENLDTCSLFVKHFELGKVKSNLDLHLAKKEYVEGLRDKPTESPTIVFDKDVQFFKEELKSISSKSLTIRSSSKPNTNVKPPPRTSISFQKNKIDAGHNIEAQKTTLQEPLTQTKYPHEPIHFSKIQKNRIAHKPSSAHQNPYLSSRLSISSASSDDTTEFGYRYLASTSNNRTSTTPSTTNGHEPVKSHSSESNRFNNGMTPRRIIDESRKRKSTDSDVNLKRKKREQNLKNLVGITEKRKTMLRDPPNNSNVIPAAIHNSQNRTVHKPSPSHKNEYTSSRHDTSAKQRSVSTSSNHTGTSSKSSSKKKRSSESRDSSQSMKKRRLSENKSKTQVMNNKEVRKLNPTLQQVSKLKNINIFDTEDSTTNKAETSAKQKPYKIPKITEVTKDHQVNSTSTGNMTKVLKRTVERSAGSILTTSQSETEKVRQNAPTSTGTATTSRVHTLSKNDKRKSLTNTQLYDCIDSKMNPRVVLRKLTENTLERSNNVKKETVSSGEKSYSLKMFDNVKIRIAKIKHVNTTATEDPTTKDAATKENDEPTLIGTMETCAVIPTQANFSQQTDAFTSNVGTQKSDDETETLIEELHLKISLLNESVRVHEQTIKKQSCELEANKSKIDEQLAMIEEREKVIIERNYQVAERKLQISDRNQKIDTYEAEIKQLQSEKELQRLQVNQLKEDNEKLYLKGAEYKRACESVCSILQEREENCEKRHQLKPKFRNQKNRQDSAVSTIQNNMPIANAPIKVESTQVESNQMAQHLPHPSIHNSPQSTAVSSSNDNNMMSAMGNIASSFAASSSIVDGSQNSMRNIQPQITVSTARSDYLLPTTSMLTQSNDTVVPFTVSHAADAATRSHRLDFSQQLGSRMRTYNQSNCNTYDPNPVLLAYGFYDRN